MSDTARIELLPLGKTIEVPLGTPLQEVLFTEGVEFPCGGRGKCKGCRVKVLQGDFPVTPEQERLLGPQAIAEGWRLSCRGAVRGDLRLELAQWEAAILADDTAFAFTPRDGLGVAVDLGTTTVVAQLLDLRTANVLAVRTGLNQQARHGADIMSRVDFAVARGGQRILEQLIRRQIGGMIAELMGGDAALAGRVTTVTIVGNTVMHHLFCGVDIAPLAQHPFVPVDDGPKEFAPAELGWNLPAARVHFLPCLGGFVGSDVLAGVLATHQHRSEDLILLIDLGTNGEIVLGNRERLLCASTAAGPAFEGAKISMGMRAATGAIAAVAIEQGALQCRVLGHTEPRGICGSGLVDAVAAGLDLGAIRPSGRLANGQTLPLCGPVVLTQGDIRELQLAKGAIAAGIRILLAEWGATPEAVTRVCLAGAFGNYISRASARRIGLLNFPLERVQPCGNTALRGAKQALFQPEAARAGYPDIRRLCRHVVLNESPLFEEIYGEEMGFPGA